MPFVTSFERYARQEGRQEGLEQGLERGRQEGREEGREEGLRQAVREALEIRFGDVPGELEARLKACTDADHLRWWLRLALTAQSPAALIDALDRGR